MSQPGGSQHQGGLPIRKTNPPHDYGDESHAEPFPADYSSVSIASAAGFDLEDDIAVPALKELEAASARGFENLLADTAAWWHKFWSKGFVCMHSADGKYHIHHVNSGEGSWNSSDTSYEVSCMHMIFPLAIRASEVLGVDADLRPIWQEIKDNLVELPTRARRDGAGAYGAFVYGGPEAITPLPPEENLKSRFLSFTRLGSFIDTAGIGGAQILRNRLRLREGPGAIDAEHIGGLTSGIHQTMLSSSGDPRLRGDRVPPAEAGVDGEPVLRIFNSLPKSWDAAFTLLARGGFVVSSSMKKGRIEFVQIQSQVGGECRLQNPWPGTTVTVYCDGKKPGDLSGSLLKFATTRGDTVVVVPKGTMPARKNVPQKL
jgi:hypothetical protein